jgi:2-keto-myo-inositol isomerase
MSRGLTRRELLSCTGLAAAGLAAGGRAAAAETPKDEWVITLNSSTIRPTPLEEKVGIAAQAGYQGIELWSNELTDYAKAGKSLEGLGKRIKDLGLIVPNIIGLWDCMPEGEAEHQQTLDRVKRQMEDARKVGATHIAAIPTPDRPNIDLLWAAERYRELLTIGDEFGVIPAVEFVGFLQGVHRLGQAAAIAIETDHRKACLVADTFHLYRGGSGFNGVRGLSSPLIAVFHFSDAPAQPPRFEQRDSDRVYPGDGILPLVQLIRDLKTIGFRGPLSLELFNEDYWKQDALEVARRGLEKVRGIVAEGSRAG